MIAILIDNNKYFVSCQSDYDGKYTIYKFDPNSCVVMRSAQIPSALLSVVYPGMFWEDAPRFDNWTKAVIYLKNNIDCML